MAQHGLPTPKNFLIKEPSQVEEAGNHVGFPAVLKPIHGAASLGVIRVENMDQLVKVPHNSKAARRSTFVWLTTHLLLVYQAHARVFKELKSARVVAGAISQACPSCPCKSTSHSMCAFQVVSQTPSYINLGSSPGHLVL